MKGLILNLQRYSIHDGPGIRTVVFLKGCPLRCLWCCNPESQLPHPELEFKTSNCQHCGKCVSVCPQNAINSDLFSSEITKIDRTLCTNCGECTFICTNEALQIAGKWRDAQDVFEDCIKDSDAFRRSGGGVTISGGEPLSQPDFLLELMSLLYQQNIHTAIETCGYSDWKFIKKIIPFTNIFLFDIKYMDPKRHYELTGKVNSVILTNLQKLAKLTNNIIIRVPLIPGFNDDIPNMKSIALIARKNGINKIHLMPFHDLGKGKYSRFGHPYHLKEINRIPLINEESEWLKQIQNIFRVLGITSQIGG